MKAFARAGCFLAVAAALIAAAMVAGLEPFAFPAAAWQTPDLLAASLGAFVSTALVGRSFGAARRQAQRLGAWIARRAVLLTVGLLLLLWLLVYLALDIFIPVKPGQGGVLWKRFGDGTVTSTVYGEGLHVIPPWDTMHIYDLRYQQQSREFQVLSTDGLLYTVEVTVRYRLRQDLLGLLHKCVGPNYVETLLVPEVGAVTRLVMAQLTPEELYTSKREASSAEMLKRLRLGVAGCIPGSARQAGATAGATPTGDRFMEADDIFIRRVVLPPKVAEAVEAKLAQRQQMLEYDYRINKERKEAERKLIEARGIQAYHDVIRQGMTPALLHWRGIDATLELARSPNSKVVIIGSNDRGGLPVVLGSLAGAESAPPAPKPESEPAKRTRAAER